MSGRASGAGVLQPGHGSGAGPVVQEVADVLTAELDGDLAVVAGAGDDAGAGQQHDQGAGDQGGEQQQGAEQQGAEQQGVQR
ncbi:hypothetical protein [Streptomyces scabiei]|uniref:hypothetical protein n=1 Tax=Streptomyces scabiei TaxID=1930 RepID=UPI0029AE7E39|nr:hypothetical protein [Streptomyces scabiei]MDX2836734.1 hypothetical protein [Streptomyces scabiei]